MCILFKYFVVLCICGKVNMWELYYVHLHMKRIDVMLPDELEERFRKEVGKKLGMKKGNISKAVQEAIEDWINNKK